MILSALKKYYQKPFRVEVEGGFEIIFYKIFTKILAFFYLAINIKRVYWSWRRFSDIKKCVKVNDKSAFVFANGPSLNAIDFNKIKKLTETGDYDLIAVNSFLSKSSNEIMPTYAVFADNLHFREDGGSQYSMDIDVCRRNSIPCFIPFQHQKLDDAFSIGYNSFCDIYSKNTSNPFLSPGFYGLTALHALRLAKYLGYKKIYICGFDNSYFKDFEVKNGGEMLIRHRHYYDAEGIDVEVPCLYDKTSEFFFDTYRHFYYIEKITGSCGKFINLARHSYLSTVRRDFLLDVYKKIA
jgi:hypothetical protein